MLNWKFHISILLSKFKSLFFYYSIWSSRNKLDFYCHLIPFIHDIIRRINQFFTALINGVHGFNAMGAQRYVISPLQLRTGACTGLYPGRVKIIQYKPLQERKKTLEKKFTTPEERNKGTTNKKKCNRQKKKPFRQKDQNPSKKKMLTQRGEGG